MKKYLLWLAVALIPVLVFATDMRIQYTERMVGANHPTRADTLNRLMLVDHGIDGHHDNIVVKTSPWVDVRAYEAVGDGTTDDSTAIANAILASSGVVAFPPGTYLIKSTITVNKRIKLLGFSGQADSTGNTGGAIIKKDATLSGAAISITSNGVVIEGLTVQGVTGNSGNGIDILANNVTLRNVSVFLMGNDGIRIGSDTGVNANSFHLDRVVSSSNTRHGVYIHDNTPDANAGTTVNLFVQANGSAGLKVGKAYLNTFVGTLAETNTGYGIHLTSDSANTRIIGGDQDEVNVAGNILNDGTGNIFVGVSDSGFTDNGTYSSILTRLVFKTYSIKADSFKVLLGDQTYVDNTTNTSWISGHYSILTSWDPASIDNNSYETKQVPAGVTLNGDETCIAGFRMWVSTIFQDGMSLSCALQSTDNVAVTITNHSGAAVNLDNGALRVDIWKH